MENRDYYIGLDIGTDSVGWAVTDTNYNILKANRKAMWGSHLFESGKTAEERRMFRTARRRTERSKERIALLNELFAEEICKVDPNFFLRLEESKYFLEDKKLAEKYNLFNDDNYTDIEYHKEYPTIYHLRSELIHNDAQHDIRLIYLAVAHIIKKRGHFLFEGQDIGTATEFSVVFEELKSALEDEGIEFNVTDALAVEELLKSKKSVNDKKKELKNLFDCKNDDSKAVCDLLAGGTVELAKMFDDETLKDSEYPKITFKSGYEDKAASYEVALGRERFILIEKIKAVYDWAILVDLLGDANYFSDAQIAIYEKHKKDLKLTKALVKKYAPDNYNKIFSENKNKTLDNYVRYSGKVSGNGYAEKYSCSQEDFCKFVLKQIGKVVPENDEESYILKELESSTAMPKQVSKNNSVIPYQLNLQELAIILDNAAKTYSFLNDIQDGKTVVEKIKMILTFKIPYYVGPLNNHSDNAWIVRKEGKIYPWNFDEMVDKTASATNFIERMTNQCTYLVGETVLPKDSILYSKYMVYNHLNNIKVDGQKLSVENKNKLFNDLYIDVPKAQKKTKKSILNYLIKQGWADKDSEITGIDNDIPVTMKSYVQFKNILGEIPNEDEIDEIIRTMTVLGESKDLLLGYLNNQFGEKYTENQIKDIARLRFTGWGNFSRAFLKDIYHVDKATGEVMCIMSALERTQDNLMQLLSRDYDFANKVEEYNAGKNDIVGGITYNDIEKLYVSPAVKRSIWRTILIVKEIVKIEGHAPKKIFVEMARDNTGDKKGQRTQSRKNYLLDCYKASKADCDAFAKSIADFDDNQLRSDKLFLYYAQLGRCMYSGEPIDLDNLLSANSRYDIDHIYPQSKTKDDSIDNRVLVKKVLNEEKTDKYPLPASFKTSQTIALWKKLKDLKLISTEKFNRLMRNDGFSANELAGFISRQIVETRQSTKAVADLLKRAYKDTSVVYVKAGNVSNFRQKYEIVKSRNVNDYHHAKDAYLNIVVGNVFDTKFGYNPAKFIEDGNVYSLNRMYDYDVKRGNTVAWLADGSTLKMVLKNVKKNNVLFTRYATEQRGGFFDQMPVAHPAGQMQLKTLDARMDPVKYGGYNKVAGAYFALVRHEVKGKTVKSFESVPIYVAKQIEHDASALKAYFETYLTNPEILLKKVKYNALLEVDGFRMHISGKTGNRFAMKCAEQLVISDENYAYFKKLDVFYERLKQKKNLKVSVLSPINKERNLLVYEELQDKLLNSKYSKKLSPQITIFESGKERFMQLSLEEQVIFLENAVVLFRCVPGSADLTLIGGSGQSGVFMQPMNIATDKSVYLVNQSITGIFENTIDLAAL